VPIPLQARAQAAVLQLLYALPRPVRRLIAGKPIRIDGQELALDAQLLLRIEELSGTGRLGGGTVEEARQELDMGQHLVAGKPVGQVHTREVAVPGTAGDVAATLYTPQGLSTPAPMLVFYHGGGFVLGNRESHDITARFLATRAGVRVLSVEYRLAPEHPFPAAVDDAISAYEYAQAKAEELGADPARIAVGGDSAGGNLAAVVAQQATWSRTRSPAFQLLLYPTVDATKRYRSRELFGEGFFLTDESMTWFIDHYVPADTDRADPCLSPLLADDLSGLPPAYIATAGFDPLRDEGEAYAERLAEAGVPVALSRQADLIHGFVSFLGIGRRFLEAAAEAAGALRVGLSRPAG
jgi:acetyl esterase